MQYRWKSLAFVSFFLLSSSLKGLSKKCASRPFCHVLQVYIDSYVCLSLATRMYVYAVCSLSSMKPKRILTKYVERSSLQL